MVIPATSDSLGHDPVTCDRLVAHQVGEGISIQYEVAKANLTRNFQGKFDKFVVPCVVASGDIKDWKASEPLNFSPHNTLYLELWCPTVAPPIIVTSSRGQTVFDFGDIAVGHRGIMKVSLQNIYPEDLYVEYSVLNPSGPFVLLNPSSKLHSGETQVLELSFSPHESIMAQETLNIITKRGTLTLTIMGTGVASMITCSIEDNVLNMGYVIARESVSSSFKVPCVPGPGPVSGEPYPDLLAPCPSVPSLHTAPLTLSYVATRIPAPGTWTWVPLARGFAGLQGQALLPHGLPTGVHGSLALLAHLPAWVGAGTSA
ncbi:cilia- and flagella-associated protein 74-like [Dipodomys spectabilis]|uniref:cilia- and flagella-associated protein 74-like n=1 Tax=Dipodomys spectabilis TaxID=105255 RepID=UPI001C54B880|nr:cilia- and flagella-associated protein 74-like [Dipodomys spectabilis]